MRSVGGHLFHERNTYTYSPWEENKAGELHQDWSIFSCGTNRRSVVSRQFHQEDNVVVCVLSSSLTGQAVEGSQPGPFQTPGRHPDQPRRDRGACQA